VLGTIDGGSESNISGLIVGVRPGAKEGADEPALAKFGGAESITGIAVLFGGEKGAKDTGFID
jgi:hypothetical protein